MRSVCLIGMVILLAAAVAPAAPIIHGANSLDGLGNYHLLPDTPDQQIQIFVRGGDPVQGVAFNIAIADGGPDAGGSVVGPMITAVDILTGTIFDGNNTGLGSAAGVLAPQIAFFSTTTATGTVPAEGLLATVTLDTTGFAAGQTFDLIVSQTVNNPTMFGAVTPTVLDGTLTMVPEPIGLLPVGGLLLLVRRRSIVKDEMFLSLPTVIETRHDDVVLAKLTELRH